MKIVLITQTLSGGVRRHIVDLLNELDKNKFDVYLLYSTDRVDKVMRAYIKNIKDNGDKYKNIKLVEIKNFHREIGFKDILAIKDIYKQIKKINPDIVHCHSSKAGAIGRICAKLLKIKKVYYTPHSYYFQNPEISNLKKNIYIKIESIFSKYLTTKTINVSNGEKREALKYNLDNNEKFHVIYNAIEKIEKIDTNIKKDIRKSLNINEDDIVIGSLSRATIQKDPNTFINIANKVLKDNNKKVKFLYIGDGELYDDLKQKVFEYNINENVILTGFRSDVNKIINIFDVYLSTALHEGMPYALIEALSSEIPIVATNVTGNNEVVVNNFNGHLFEPKNHDDGVNCIYKLIKYENIRKYYGKNSFKIFNENFNIKDMINNYEKLYKNSGDD